MGGRGSYPLPMIIQGSHLVSDVTERLRTGSVHLMFDSLFRYEIPTEKWNQTLVGGATNTWISKQNVRMRATTASGDRAIIQTRRYWEAHPSKAYVIRWGALLGAGKTNVKQRLGYFDNNDGAFFEYDGTTMYCVTRNNGSDTRVAQSEWNMNTADGTDQDKCLVDWTKAQVYSIEHSGGAILNIRFGLVVNHKRLYVHEVCAANESTTATVSTLDLPLRAEIYNSGTSASTTDLTIAGATLYGEAPFLSEYGIRVASRANFGVSVTTKRPVLSIRPRTSYQGQTMRRVLKPRSVTLTSTGNDLFYEVLQLRPGNGTLVGANFTGVASDSLMMVDYKAGTAIGGTVRAIDFVPAGYTKFTAGAEGRELMLHYLALNPSGTISDILTINCSAIGGATVVRASIDWYEK